MIKIPCLSDLLQVAMENIWKKALNPLSGVNFSALLSLCYAQSLYSPLPLAFHLTTDRSVSTASQRKGWKTEHLRWLKSRP